MQELFANNAESALASGITSTGTSITLVTGEGARFPAAVTGTSQFRAVLVDGTTIVEYVTVTNRAGDVLTVTRESEDATRFPKAARLAGVKVIAIASATALGLIAVPAGAGGAGKVLVSGSADYAQAWTDPKWAGGDYFRSGYYSMGVVTTATYASTAAVLSRLYFRPFRVPVRRAFDRIGVNVVTGGGAGALLRMGIYADGGGIPGALIVDAGTVDSSASGAKAIVISQTLDPGLYWVAVAPQAVTCTLSMHSGPLFDPGVAVGTAPPSFENGVCHMQASVTGALPNPAVPAAGGVGNMPAVLLRAV